MSVIAGSQSIRARCSDEDEEDADMRRNYWRRRLLAAAILLCGTPLAGAQSQQPEIGVHQDLRAADAEIVQGGSVRASGFGFSAMIRDNVALIGMPNYFDLSGSGGSGRMAVWTR